ncbi:MAG: hybrid sensor histidine kinase/response regulator [Myxococcales bacterium]|nr:hybrid sensor histidine kinase/response regulator [Myxococcales bacterium]
MMGAPATGERVPRSRISPVRRPGRGAAGAACAAGVARKRISKRAGRTPLCHSTPGPRRRRRRRRCRCRFRCPAGCSLRAPGPRDTSERVAPRVYVVDDDALVTESLGTALRLETDWEVATFNDARVALAEMDGAPPDVVLSDLKMPALPGIAFLGKVRERFPTAVLLLLTGYADKESAIRAINEVGIWQYVEKPWDTADLLLTIRQGLERRDLVGTLHRTNAELEGRVREVEAAHQRLVASERMAAVGRVAAGLAHELGNQLALVGYAEAIAARTEDRKVKQFAEVIVAAQRRLAAMVDELKDFARGTDEEYAREPADVAGVVEEALQILRFDRELTGRKLRPHLRARPLGRIHRGKIMQVVINLVRNAAQASEIGDEVEIAIAEEDGGTLLKVSDRGTGMSAAVQARLGEPFFTTKERGSGLGLGISRRIVEEHGGRLVVRSEAGVGTEVSVWLPGLEVAATATETETETETGTGTGTA